MRSKISLSTCSPVISGMPEPPGRAVRIGCCMVLSPGPAAATSPGRTRPSSPAAIGVEVATVRISADGGGEQSFGSTMISLLGVRPMPDTLTGEGVERNRPHRSLRISARGKPDRARKNRVFLPSANCEVAR